MESIILFVSKHLQQTPLSYYSFVYFSSKRNECVHSIPMLNSIREKGKEKYNLSWMSWCTFATCTEHVCWMHRNGHWHCFHIPILFLSLSLHSKWHFERQLKCRNRFYRSILTQSSINHHNCTSMALSTKLHYGTRPVTSSNNNKNSNNNSNRIDISIKLIFSFELHESVELNGSNPVFKRNINK